MSGRILAAAVAAGLLVPASAGATTFCVSTPPGCVGTPIAAGSLDDLLNSGDPRLNDGQADTVVLDAGDFVDTTEFDVANVDPMVLRGAGSSDTTLTSSSSSNQTILDTTVSGGPLTIQDLEIAIPASFPDDTGGTGFAFGADVVLERVRVTGTSNPDSTGIEVGNTRTATLRDVSVDTPEGTALSVRGKATFTGGDLQARYAVHSQPQATTTIERAEVFARAGADFSAVAIWNLEGTVTVRDSIVAASTQVGEEAIGILTMARFDHPATTVADHVTLHRGGSLGTNTIGLDTRASSTGVNAANVTFTNGIVGKFQTVGERSAGSAGDDSPANVTLRYSNVNGHPAGTGNGAVDTSIGNLYENTAFNIDSTPLPGSAVIDAGDPGFAPLFGALDKWDKPRVMDGNLDGTARTDMGAVEVEGPLPVLPVDPPGPPPPSAPAPGASPPPPAVMRVPARDALKPRARFRTPGAIVRRGTKVRFAGTAADASGVARVEVAVVRLLGGARAAARSCRSVDAKARATRIAVRRGRCSPTTWLRATGATSWSLRMSKALPKGAYVAYVRATDRAGNRSDPVRRRFRVR
jgi:hypothetical protein